jgi:nitronate monooxygenase
MMQFDPVQYAAMHGQSPPRLSRPDFFAVISSHSLASAILRRANGRVDGFVVENPTAGGHNAQPRRSNDRSPDGEPIYGLRDQADFEVMRSLDRPFWIAGTQAVPDALASALEVGATGIQVGTAFAFCEESGLAPELKEEIIQQVRIGSAQVFTDPLASPSGFPFKVVQLNDTIADHDTYERRTRRCDLGYFRTAYVKKDGSLGWRCPAESPDAYVRKGGKREDTIGRKCICNALMATAGLPQLRTDGYVEQPIVTAGQDLSQILRFLNPKTNTYAASEVIDTLLQCNEHLNR